MFNFKRLSVFSEVSCLVTPMEGGGEGGNLPRANMEVNLVETGISRDVHPADFLYGHSMHPRDISLHLFFLLYTLKCAEWVGSLMSPTHLSQTCISSRMPADTLVLHGLNYKVEL